MREDRAVKNKHIMFSESLRTSIFFFSFSTWDKVRDKSRDVIF